MNLSPPLLQEEGLTDALGWLVSQMESRHVLHVQIEAEQSFAMAEDMRVLLFQIIRELLFNVAKHAETDQATVALREEAGHLVIQVSDRGQGFDLGARRETGLGLRNSHEWLSLVGGRLEIASRPGQGTQATLYTPLSRSREGNWAERS